MPIPDAKKIELNNGLKIVTEQIPSLRSVSMGILIGAGSGNETDAEAGLSHLIEHMSFKGTPKRSAHDIAMELDSVGGKINAYTGKEQTMYYAVVLDQHIDLAIDILCDLLMNPLFEPKDLALEKSVILEEIKMYEDTPDELIHDYFAEKILHGHPVGRPTIGFKKTIESFHRREIDHYREKWYTPGNTTIALAGAIPDDATERIMSYLHHWKGQETPQPPNYPAVKCGLHLKHKKTEQVHLCLGVQGPSQLDNDRYPYAVLDTILGGSMSSRLFQEVREKRGLAYSIYSTATPFRHFGLSYIYAGMSKKYLAEVIDLILKEIRNFKKHGVTAEELKRGKEFLKGSLVLGMESTTARMSWLARSEFYYNRPMTIDEVFRQVDGVTNDEIIRLANNHFREKFMTLAVIGDLKRLPVKELSC